MKKQISALLLPLMLFTVEVFASSADEISSTNESRMLPFWGEQAKAQGYQLPEPFGINFNYMNMHQNIDVQSIEFSNLVLGKIALPSDVFLIEVGKTRQKSKTKMLKLDAWVLPFLNVYGVFGKTNGSSISKISVDGNTAKYPLKIGPNFLNGLIAKQIHGMYMQGAFQDLDFELKFKGKTYGAGFVLAGGYQDIFTLVDTNYTFTRFDILDGQIRALTVSPRIGYSFSVPAISKRTTDARNLKIWVGSMYQNIQQEFKGSLADLSMPPNLVGLIGTVDKNGQGRFRVKQRLESPWNMLVGSQYEITPYFNLLTEFGFNKRNSFFVAGEYRF